MQAEESQKLVTRVRVHWRQAGTAVPPTFVAPSYPTSPRRERSSSVFVPSKTGSPTVSPWRESSLTPDTLSRFISPWRGKRPSKSALSEPESPDFERTSPSFERIGEEEEGEILFLLHSRSASPARSRYGSPESRSVSPVGRTHILSQEQAAAIRKLAQCSVKRKTYEGYLKTIGRIEEFLARKGYIELTMGSFAQMLQERGEYAKGKKASCNLRSAARMNCVLGNWPLMREALLSKKSGDYAMLSQLCAGFNHVCGERADTPGSIDLQHFEQLISYIKIAPHIRSKQPLLRAFAVIFGMALRVSEYFALQVGDLHEDPDGNTRVFLREDKRFKAGSGLQGKEHYRTVISLDAIEKFRAQERYKRHVRGAKLFTREEAGHGELARIIKEAADAQNWDTRLRWHPHCLRHGGAHEIVRVCKGEMEARAQDATTMCRKTIEAYSLPNEERIKRIQAGETSFTQEFDKTET
jgi:hypothetical protein